MCVCRNLVGSCRLLLGANHIAGCSWGSGQIWRCHWGTLQTLHHRCNTTSHHDLRRAGKKEMELWVMVNIIWLHHDVHHYLFVLRDLENICINRTFQMKASFTLPYFIFTMTVSFLASKFWSLTDFHFVFSRPDSQWGKYKITCQKPSHSISTVDKCRLPFAL